MPNYTSHVVATPSLETDVECLRREILPLPPPVDKPCMAVLSGLPGSGKTTFARNLAARVPLAILESDALRKALFTQPSYSANESRRLFGAIHQLAYELLLDGISVLVDATNLRESNRMELYGLAERADARLFLVCVEAPREVIRNAWSVVRYTRTLRKPLRPTGGSTGKWPLRLSPY